MSDAVRQMCSENRGSEWGGMGIKRRDASAIARPAQTWPKGVGRRMTENTTFDRREPCLRGA